MKRCNIIYLTKNQAHASAFESRAKEKLIQLKESYLGSGDDIKREQAKSSLYNEINILDSIVLERGGEPWSFLDTYSKKLSELYVIIDYISFCSNKEESGANSIKIREMILKFPEVHFAFDEHLLHKYNVTDVSFIDFLFADKHLNNNDFITALPENEQTNKTSQAIINLINKEMHSFDIDESDECDKSNGNKRKFNSILRLCYFNDNLFDASNLRFALKAMKYHDLDVNKRNFARIQLSRAENLALVVEEERSQSLFNCYAAFANGYRSLPVTTAQWLNWINGNELKPQIILRDYDLQFPDELNRDDIHKIRGWRCRKGMSDSPWLCSLTQDNGYWSNLYYYITPEHITLDAHQVYYISKGVRRLKIDLKGNYGIQPSDKNNDIANKLRLPGIAKPISGIYTPFEAIFSKTYNDAIYTSQNSSSDCIDTKRKLGNHGVPLDIYYMVKSMMDRAEQYCYIEKRFVHAAILAQEIIEVLNGFHESLLIQAYHLLAISENAISMNVVGGDEEDLEKDAIFRIKKIRYEVDRILRRPSEIGDSFEDRRELTKNILNQIFSDCRQYCKETEHYKAEDCFISAMAHINEGLPPDRLLQNIQDGIERICTKIKVILSINPQEEK